MSHSLLAFVFAMGAFVGSAIGLQIGRREDRPLPAALIACPNGYTVREPVAAYRPGDLPVLIGCEIVRGQVAP